MKRKISILHPLTGIIFGVSFGLASSFGNLALGQGVNALEKLNPDPDLLYLPNRPEQVRLGEPLALTLEESLALAEKNNRELQIARESFRGSTFGLNQARAALLPKIGTQVEFFNGRDAKDTIDNLENRDSPKLETPLDARLEISYDVYTSGGREARISAAEEQVRLAKLEVERVQKQVYLEITLAYYELQENSERVRIARAAVNNSEITLRDARLLEESEIGTKFDVIRAEVQLANTRQELTDVLTEQDISRRQLAQLLGLSESADLIASDAVKQKGTWTLNLNDSIILAYQNRVELQQEIARSNISARQRQIALSETGPRVSLFAGYQLRNDFETNFGVVDGYVVGTRLRWDFFDGGASRAAADRERSNQLIEETRFAETRNKIRLEVERAYKRLQASAKNIQTATFANERAEESLTLARLRFQAGAGTQLDVIAAENDLTRADSQRISAILNYNRAFAELQKAVNKASN